MEARSHPGENPSGTRDSEILTSVECSRNGLWQQEHRWHPEPQSCSGFKGRWPGRELWARSP